MPAMPAATKTRRLTRPATKGMLSASCLSAVNKEYPEHEQFSDLHFKFM